MFIDSHCHLDFPDLSADVDGILSRMEAARVTHALCVAVTLEDLPRVLDTARRAPNLFASVGVHPDYPDIDEPDADRLVALADDPKVIAIGETGLDYFRLEGDLEWQRERFRAHIRAARRCGKPLIVHTRAAADDTIRILREEGAEAAGGVMHCFTESWEVARDALDLGFRISFSGIVTFRNAAALREVAAKVPEDRLLIETDSPYLAPVPHRGRRNEPAYVADVAAGVASVRGVAVERIGEATTANFFDLFRHARPAAGRTMAAA